MLKAYADPISPAQWSAMASRMVTITADVSSGGVAEGITSVLNLLRTCMHMDAVFVAEFTNGQQVLRYVDAEGEECSLHVGSSTPLEQSWCQRVVDGRLPPLIVNVAKFSASNALPSTSFDIGTYISTPVFLKSGRLYGTLCAISFEPVDSVEHTDLTNLKAVALVLAEHLGQPIR